MTPIRNLFRPTPAEPSQSPPRSSAPATRMLEQRRPFRSSLLWEIQRRYFSERGADAWRGGEVPHYITSNPTIANAYAEIVFAFRRDLDRLGRGCGPLTICELGAGSGRFAFHFLRRLEELCDEAGGALDMFRYVLTDVVQANLDALRRHPRFQPYLERGLVDTALYDIVEPGPVLLQASGARIIPGSLESPLVAIANYVFDGVPQDLFHFAAGEAAETRVSLNATLDPEGMDAAELLGCMELEYTELPLARPPYPEPDLQALFDEYRSQLADTHLLFPAPAIRGLQQLAALSRGGLLLLTADRGDHSIGGLDHRPPPSPSCHGSVSLPVNYHALVRSCEMAGGQALLPSRPHRNIDVLALLCLARSEAYEETRRAYRRHVQQFGPDDFYLVALHARETLSEMSVETLLAFLRMSRHDAHHLARCLPRLVALAPVLAPAARREVRAAIDDAWALHFPLGEAIDLAHELAALLYAIDDYEGALAYYERSIGIYGVHTGTLFNMACCHHLLGRPEAAASLLREALRHDSANRAAVELLRECTPSGLVLSID